MYDIYMTEIKGKIEIDFLKSSDVFYALCIISIINI